MGIKNIMVRKGITLLAILVLFLVFSGEFGCKKQAAVSQPENFTYLEGTFVQRTGKILIVKADDGQKINFRVGRRTVFTPKEWPAIGDRLTVRYLDNVLSHESIGNYFIAYEVTKVGHTPDVGPKTAIVTPPPVIQDEKKTIPEIEKAKIAILEFQGLNEQAKKDNMGKMVTEIMTTSLVNSRAFNIIEREKLSKVLKEFQLSQTGLIDAASAKEIGKILGADAIVTGSVMMLRERLRLDARIIDVGTGAIIAAESTLGSVDIQSLGLMCDRIVDSIIIKYYERSLKLINR
ncbi:MAG TPA: FlgO family outer membrane protein [Desulfatiglandales bacterium]|nr:FlgO family outer membrane protein [Desulfatiglandales bacterium]